MSNHPAVSFDFGQNPNNRFNFNRSGAGRNAPSPNVGGFRNIPNIGSSNLGAPVDNLFGPSFDFETDMNFGTGDLTLGEVDIGGDFKWFGEGGALIPGLKTLGALFDTKYAGKTVRAQERADKFNMAMGRTNLANQAQITNAQIEGNARSVGQAMGLQGQQLDNYISTRMSERRVAGTI